MGNNCVRPKKKKHSTRIESDSNKSIQLQESRNNSQPSQKSYFIKQIPTKNVLDKNQQWDKLLGRFPDNSIETCLKYSKYSGKMLKMIKQGPPTHLRWETWKALVSLDSKLDLDLYRELPYGDYQTMAAIHRDIDRTFPDQPYFGQTADGQTCLHNLLGKLGGKHPQMGYCQSLNFLAGFLLLINKGNEFEAFFMLEALLVDYQLKDFYTQQLSHLKRAMWVFDRIFSKKHPELVKHFETQGIILEMWAMQWFMALFTTALSPNIVARIWDLFLIERISVLYKVSLAIVGRFEKDLLCMDTSEICNFFKTVHHFIHSPKNLFAQVLKIDISQSSIKLLEREYDKTIYIEPLIMPQMAKTQENSYPSLQRLSERFSGAIFINTADMAAFSSRKFEKNRHSFESGDSYDESCVEDKIFEFIDNL